MLSPKYTLLYLHLPPKTVLYELNIDFSSTDKITMYKVDENTVVMCMEI